MATELGKDEEPNVQDMEHEQEPTVDTGEAEQREVSRFRKILNVLRHPPTNTVMMVEIAGIGTFVFLVVLIAYGVFYL